jgi:plasmid stability protein
VPNLTVRNLSEETHGALRMRAARHGRSIEAEVRFILEETVRPADRLKIGSEIHRIAQGIVGIDDLEIRRQWSDIQERNSDDRPRYQRTAPLVFGCENCNSPQFSL